MSEFIEKLGMGWLPDYPDYRDYTIDHKDIKPMIKEIGVTNPSKVSIPASKDLRTWCSPIENQFSIGSCTANAGVGIIEYYERRAFGKHIDASRLFLYKATRNLLHWTGDRGAFLRTTMGAMVLFGVPPEEYWPYIIADFDKEPSAFCYAFAQNYQTIKYFRLDPPVTKKDVLLKRIKTLIAYGLPSMFGFTVYNSIGQSVNDGKIPYPCPGEKIAGGHAVVAVGYNNKMKIKNTICGKETTGALLIRNSWGAWGDNGYGWLPYDYVLDGLAIDWWTLLKIEWVDTGRFKL
ncbi:MAG: C1 family peptidase [Thermodesulfobacteriota bacterium]|nr:C1 family peptidase [Thermodesulfobacteriota bacterium]